MTFVTQDITVTERRRFFAESSDPSQTRPFIYADSAGYVGVAVRNNYAARMLAVAPGDAITFNLH